MTDKVPCPHWKECSGCPLIKFDYKKQLNLKTQKVVDAFLEAGFAEKWVKSTVRPTRPSPLTLGYRNKAKWILQETPKGELKMGIYKSGTHEVVDIPHCSVHAPAINEVSASIKKLIKEHKVPVGSVDPKEPTLRYVIVRYSFRDKKLIAVFVTSQPQVPGLEVALKKLGAEYSDKIVAIVQNINDETGNVLLGEANRYIKKSGELTESLGSLRVPVGPLSFLQVNSNQASFLYKRVREILGKGPYKAGLDLYSGVGLMALHMAPVTKRILAVEEVGPAALEGITAARRNRVHNVLQLCADAIEGVETFHKEWGSPDWVILNPPRKGCDESVLQSLAQKAPKKLVYVSCSPKTLARDLKLLKSLDESLEIKLIEPVDMFPQTDHVECIVLLESRSGPAPKKKVRSAGKPVKKSKTVRSAVRSKTLH